MDIFFRLVTGTLYTAFRLFYRCRVYGDREAHPGAAIIAPNHLSFLDPPLIAAFWPQETHFLAKASLFDTSLMAWLLPKLHSHPVQGTAQDIQSMKLVCQLLKEGNKVVIFPEGNRSEDGHLQPVKAGVGMLALRMHCPIIPVYIDGTFEAWPRHSRWPKAGATIGLVIGSPIVPDNFTHLSKKEAQTKMSEEVLSSMERLKSWYQNGANGSIPS